jgi:hypothetical protein
MTVTITLPDDTAGKAKEYLKRDGFTLSGFVRKHLLDYIEEKEMNKGEKNRDN